MSDGLTPLTPVSTPMATFARQVATVLQTLPAGFGQLGFVKQGDNVKIAADGTLSVPAGSGTAVAAQADLAIVQALVSALQAGKLPQGTYSAVTGLPSLATVGAVGDYYEVATTGTVAIPGYSGPVAIGDQLVSTGTAWYRVPLGGTYLPAISPTASGIFTIGGAGQYGSSLPIALAIEDQFGTVSFYVDTGGLTYSMNTPATGSLAGIYAYSQAGLPAGAVYVQDQFGTVSSSLGVGSTVATAQNAATSTGSTFIAGSTVFTQADVDNMEAEAAAYSAGVRAKTNTTAQRPTRQYNIAAEDGQSENTTFQAGPILYNNARIDNLMLGGATRTDAANMGGGTSYVPVGGSLTLQPLADTLQNDNNGNPLPNRVGGFQNISAITLGPNGTISIPSGATATMVQLVGGTLTYTPVGGAGQAALDLTQVLKAGDSFALCGSGVTGGAYPSALQNIYATVGTVTASATTAGYQSTGWGLNGATPTLNGVDLVVTNNGLSIVGQDCESAGTDSYRRAELNARFLETDSTRRHVVINASVGSTTIAALSKGATPNIYNVLVDAVAKVAAIGGAGSTCVASESWAQGGNDAGANMGTGTGYQTYGAGFYAYIQSRISDWQTTYAQRPPLFICQQLSPANANHPAPSLAIAQAQYDTIVAQKFGGLPDAYMMGPICPYPNWSSAHMPANSVRWRGEMNAKIKHRVWIKGEGWEPLHPITVLGRVSEALINCHCPAGALRTAAYFNGMVQIATIPANLNFSMNDTSGANSVVSASIVGDATIHLMFTRAITAPFSAVTADPTLTDGTMPLTDSDSWIAQTKWEYQEFMGFHPLENIPALVGFPYNCANWCVVGTWPGVMG